MSRAACSVFRALGGKRGVWVLGAVLALGASACSSDPPVLPPANLGAVFSRPIPQSIAQLPLTDQHGATITLASLRGKTVLVVPFLTLCSEVCPMTTGNLLQVQRALEQDKAAPKVEIVEITGDPERDDVARLAAYAHLTGSSWELVTESRAEFETISKFFGYFFVRVPQDKPPAVDWLTAKPLTYDVLHSNGYFIIDRQGRERFSTGAAPDFHGTLNPTLHRFLSAQGRKNLAHPSQPAWDPASALRALSWVLGRNLPMAAG